MAATIRARPSGDKTRLPPFSGFAAGLAVALADALAAGAALTAAGTVPLSLAQRAVPRQRFWLSLQGTSSSGPALPVQVPAPALRVKSPELL